MKRFLILAIAIAIPVACVTLPIKADPPPVNDSTLTPLMRMKLDRSKAILEGLTMEDFDKIATNARALKLLSTEAGWNVIQSPEYDSQSRDFRRSADLIMDAAKSKDISRATLGYVAMTVRCVECHSYMRKHRIDLLKLTP